MSELTIRPAIISDSDAIWQIIEPIIRRGDTYVFSPASSRERMLEYWLAKQKHTFVAEVDGQVVGTYWLVANQPDLGAHIANAAYMVAPNQSGKGIGKKMCQDSIEKARDLGFQAIQFNFVVKSNESAVKLWLKMGFKIIGEIPEAFQHPTLGLTNALIMHRKI